MPKRSACSTLRMHGDGMEAHRLSASEEEQKTRKIDAPQLEQEGDDDGCLLFVQKASEDREVVFRLENHML